MSILILFGDMKQGVHFDYAVQSIMKSDEVGSATDVFPPRMLQ